MIPEIIQPKHIYAALDEIDRNRVPANRDAQKFFVERNGHRYPAKYVVALACKHATGTLLSWRDFKGGEETNLFLRSRGFQIVDYGGKPVSSKPTSNTSASPKPPIRSTAVTTRHSERCPECKQRIEQLLAAVYGQVRQNPRLKTSATLESYKRTAVYDALRPIYKALQQQRGHDSFVRSESLANCDFLVPTPPGFLVEFDESQHFTASRKLSLSLYPEEGVYGFERSRWMELCDEINAHDNDPPFRDEQRAWYDTLRDLIPQILNMSPTVRLHAAECQWCAMNPADPNDLTKFRQIIVKRTNF
jgi:hypothetical protein